MEFFDHFSICSDYFLYLCPQIREIYHGKIKSDKNRSSRARPEQQVAIRQTRYGSRHGVKVGHQYHPAKP